MLAFSETLWLWGDAVMEVVGQAHREVELQLAREEQQRRDAFVLAVLLGTIDADELSREAGGYGLDPEREYVAFRARALDGPRAAADRLRRPHHRARPRPRRALHRPPRARSPAWWSASGRRRGSPPCPPPSRWPAARCRPRSPSGRRACSALADLSIRPAILSDEALGDAFTGRHLEPLQALGRLGAELEDTLRVWFEQEMRIEETAKALHVHPNTLRHRLRRFEETTGANLRRPADLIELWWALERRQLGRTAPAPPAPARSPTRGSSAAPAAGPV